MASILKRVLVGRPLATHESHTERLGKPTALAIFASDAIASSAFATQEILHVLVPVAGMAALGYLVPISGLVVVLLLIVVTSYRQTIFAYPNGGGSYVVSRENLGTNTALVAGAALLVDYVLTVAVSIAAGTAAITSAIEPLRDHRVALAVGLCVFLAIANLRGIRESGRTFVVPTYVYIASMAALIIWGLFQSFSGDLDPLPVDQEALAEVTENGTLLGATTLFLLMRAFSSGAVALSGVEAISNGIPAFKPPESRNAATTLTITGVILAVLFSGVALLSERLQPTLSENETILSIMGRAVFGGDSPLYYILQAGTAAILVLSANTAYADFPRLSSIIARDGFLPRQLATRGDRLVYSNGIILLTIAAAGLLVGFGGITTLLIPLFAVGLFLSFTLSQAGMVVHHWRLRESGWRRGATVNAVGAVATAIVLVVVVVSKFLAGAWIPTVVIPLIFLLFRTVHRHYRDLGQAIVLTPNEAPLPDLTHTVVVLVGRIHRGLPAALAYARSLQPRNLVALTVVVEEGMQPAREDWDRFGFDIPLEVVSSPYRELTSRVEEYLDELDERWADDVITVVVPEVVVHSWWENALHNQSAFALKTALLFRPNTVVISVPVQYNPGAPEGMKLRTLDTASRPSAAPIPPGGEPHDGRVATPAD